MFSVGTHDLLSTGVLLQFTGPRSTVDAFLFLLVPLYDLTLLTMIIYTASQAVIILTLTLFNFIKIYIAISNSKSSYYSYINYYMKSFIAIFV